MLLKMHLTDFPLYLHLLNYSVFEGHMRLIYLQSIETHMRGPLV